MTANSTSYIINSNINTNSYLYIVGTPIGNLADISSRAIDILLNSDLILAEDTRHSKSLLNKYNINTKLLSYHKFNEQKRTEEIINLYKDNHINSISLITDAGMPCISDPGYLIVKNIYEYNSDNLNKKIKVISIPGPSSVTAAISISGINCEKFIFEGFLNNKKTARIKQLENLKLNSQKAIILFEAPHRLIDLLEDISKVFNNYKIAVIKEITKQYERVYYGNVEEVLDNLNKNNNKIKGEYVVIIESKSKLEFDLDKSINNQEIINKLNLLKEEYNMTNKQAVDIISRLYNIKKNLVYNLSIK